MIQFPGWTRLVIEKPFGEDLETAQHLNQLVFRFSNPIFEHSWHRDRVERVEITVAEQLGLEGRAGYYDQVGALRDMVQNHLTQLLALTAMDVPGASSADAIRAMKK